MADKLRTYTLAPVFCIRAAGVPFEPLDSVASPHVARVARELLTAREALDRVAAVAIDVAREASTEEAAKRLRKVNKALRARRPVTAEQREADPWLEPYTRALVEVDRITADLEHMLEAEAVRVHTEVRRHAVRELPDLALIESPLMLDKLSAIAREPPAPTVGSYERKVDRALAMYLQRVCAKGDTISRFGPSAWGRVVDAETLRIDPVPGIDARSIEVERWVVSALIDVINADPDVRAEVSPRLHPDAIVEQVVTRIDRAEPITVTAEESAILARCDGQTPAHQLGDLALLARLADAGAILWQLERFAVDNSPLASLIADVEAWRELDVRARWLRRLVRVRDLGSAFGNGGDVVQRQETLATLQTELVELGVQARERGRTLYAAANPISENCSRDIQFELPRRAVDRLANAASPWFDFFGDAYALGVARAFALYRDLASTAPRRGGRLSYADLCAHARSREISIENDGALVRVARETFAEISRVFGEALEDRANGVEIELTAADCHVLRTRYDLPTVAELSYPQADLQIACASREDFDEGRYRWVVAELHQPFMPLQYALYWSCPDKPALHAAMAKVMCDQPIAIRGSLTEQPVHIAGESVFAAMPRPTFVDRGRAKPGWRSVRPVDAEVVVDDQARDVRLRSPAGEDLGSLVRCFRIMMGMHPFFPYSRAPHAPRLRMGNTIVQRRTWNVTSVELGVPRPSGVSAAFVVAIERLRKTRDIPRWVFARPKHDQLQAGGIYARDKDVKPFYVDLESVLYLDIFERRLQKYEELVISEMLPSPEELVWSEPSGRTVFELRTSLVPAG
jgi:hypothetical protein